MFIIEGLDDITSLFKWNHSGIWIMLHTQMSLIALIIQGFDAVWLSLFVIFNNFIIIIILRVCPMSLMSSLHSAAYSYFFIISFDSTDMAVSKVDLTYD